MESPPRRITRSRATTKGSEPALKPAKIITAAAKAKAKPKPTTSSTTTSETKSTATKRKTRADDNEEDEQEPPARKPARGRPRKAVESTTHESTTAQPKLARGRPAKKATTEVSKDVVSTHDAIHVTAPSSRPVRGRPRKATVTSKEKPEELAAGSSAPDHCETAEQGPKVKQFGKKKTVSFQEPDKENFEPVSKQAISATGGIRGRPTRKVGVVSTSTKSTKSTSTASTIVVKKPLSPKKVTQMRMCNDVDSSEDELAVDKKHAPQKALKKAPMKPPIAKAPSQDGKQTPAESDPVRTETEKTASLDAPPLRSSVIASPAKRLPTSPFKESMRSPAKKIGAIPFPGSTIKVGSTVANSASQASPSKSGLLQSAAKRPQSPIKQPNFSSFNPGQASSSSHSAVPASVLRSPPKRAVPGIRPMTEPRQRQLHFSDESTKAGCAIPATPTPMHSARRASRKTLDGATQQEVLENPFKITTEILQLPRPQREVTAHTRPQQMTEDREDNESSVISNDGISNHEQTHESNPVEFLGEDDGLIEENDSPIEEETAIEYDEVRDEVKSPGATIETGDAQEDQSESPATIAESMSEPPSRLKRHTYSLRQRDLDPYHDMDSGSDEEMGSPLRSRTSRKSYSPSKDSRRATLGLTDLANQLGSWSANTPTQRNETRTPMSMNEQDGCDVANEAAPEVFSTSHSPCNQFFEDEMHIETMAAEEPQAPAATVGDEAYSADIEEPVFEDIEVTGEDLDLAQEADEMSMIAPEDLPEIINSPAFDDNLSDTSEEYGDENEVPIDPVLLAPLVQALPITPKRPLSTSFNTTTKVPLKPADESTPIAQKMRSFSTSRVVPRRPTNMSRNVTVISYSPTKNKSSNPVTTPVRHRTPSSTSAAPISSTLNKSENWSVAGTPARTPKKDIDPALLRGAVVFVDVHTSEGADASGIFTELLMQMGARCVKTWGWSPGNFEDDSADTDKVGITHVVFKDGGKRTMEKVRQSNGVAQCVGVSWVLDCERENQWLDEAPYYIDTSLVPRGGARRRKSMEPKALANINGTLVNSTNKTSGATGSQTAPNTPMNRRESALWVHTPSDQGDDDDDLVDEYGNWTTALLTPVPKTPAPEAVARYAAEIPQTPSNASTYDFDDSPSREELLMRTCPPKSNKYEGLGRGVLSERKDEQVMLRLIQARRKSLQFAPKIGSPLARTWN